MEQGCIAPLCDLLTVMDSKIVQVALNGLENILRLGEQDAKQNNGVNPYVVMIEECYGECEMKQSVWGRWWFWKKMVQASKCDKEFYFCFN